MEPMMFSDCITMIRSLGNLSSGVLVLFPMLAFLFWLLSKVFRAVVLDGHPIVLSIAALVFFTIANSMATDGNHIAAMVFFIPLLFIGRVAYLRLIRS